MKNQNLLDALNRGRVSVHFTKANGEHREMICSLHNDYIVDKTFSRNKACNEVAQSVWDIEKEAWRSFRWDRVEHWSVLN